MSGPPDIEGATDSPILPRIVEGRWYLDLSVDSLLDEVRLRIKDLPREVLCVFDTHERLIWAPVVGETGSVDISGIAGRLKGRIVSHNHPKGGMLSDRDMARIEAVYADGDVLAWNRPDAVWPDRHRALRAYVTGYNRAVGVAKLRGKSQKPMSAIEFRAELLRQVDRTLGSTGDFGQNALAVGRSVIERRQE